MHLFRYHSFLVMGFSFFKCRSETTQESGGPTEKYEQNFVLLKIIDFPSLKNKESESLIAYVMWRTVGLTNVSIMSIYVVFP